MALILQVNDFRPLFGSDCFLAENATISGDVISGNHCSIWFNAVIRGDVNPIRIGDYTNIQDAAIIHGSFEQAPTIIGDRVTIGHKAIIHGCTIEDDALIGMGAIILDKAIVGKGCIVAAGAVVLENSILEAGNLYAGIPAKKMKLVSETQKESIGRTAKNYPKYASWYSSGFNQTTITTSNE